MWQHRGMAQSHQPTCDIAPKSGCDQSSDLPGRITGQDHGRIMAAQGLAFRV